LLQKDEMPRYKDIWAKNLFFEFEKDNVSDDIGEPHQNVGKPLLFQEQGFGFFGLKQLSLSIPGAI